MEARSESSLQDHDLMELDEMEDVGHSHIGHLHVVHACRTCMSYMLIESGYHQPYWRSI